MPKPQSMDDRKIKNLHEFVPTPFLKNMAMILEPSESEAPILSKPIRESMFQWMKELDAAEELKKVKVEPRKRLMFYGPPGCGKTTLAHHIAARLGLPLILVNMQVIVGMYLGETGNNINQLFRDLKGQDDQCILFMDEFDSIATKRVAAMGGGGAQNERNSMVVAILQRMDDYNGSIIAATNRHDEIDPAVWRRFNMHIEIKEPDNECRWAILKRYMAPYDCDEELLTALMEGTAGASPALIKALAESLKRDLILGPRLNQSTDIESCLRRATSSCQGHAGATVPRLWDDMKKYAEKAQPYWPPKLP